MLHWDHRVVKETLDNGEVWYSVREVYYNKDGSIFGYTDEPVGVVGESVDEIREELEMTLKCLDNPVLVDGEVEFVDVEGESHDGL